MLPKNIVKLERISPKAWEHPADRAALTALRQIPGLDELVRLLVSVTTERSLQLMHYASSVKVGPTQFPRLHSIVDDIVETFDWDYRPTVFVTQSPFFNAHVFGAKEPFIILNSSILRTFDEAEVRAIVAHEMGHIMSGHALYKTLMWLLANLSLSMIPGAAVLGMAVGAALSEWDRKSELTADRAALLATQAEDPNFTVLMRMAGGDDLSEVNVNDFFLQAQEYEGKKTLLDSFHKLLNLMWASHPYPVMRLQELKAWSLSGAFGGILAGEYPRRDSVPEDLRADVKEAYDYYKTTMGESDDPLTKLASGIGTGLEKAVGDIGDRLKELFGQ